MKRPSGLPLLFFDTNVARTLKDQPPEDLKRFWRWVHAHHRYAIVPLVLVELLKSLRGNPNLHLEDVRREFWALRGPSGPIMLPLPEFFLARTLFSVGGDHPIVSATAMAKVLEAGRRLKRVLRRNGQVLLVNSTEDGAIVLDSLIDPIAKGEQSMINVLAATKKKGSAPLQPLDWAGRTLQALGLQNTPENCRILADACRAAYTLQRFLRTQAARNYNPVKNRSDWMDFQLLLYLAYPRAVFVTCERKLPARITGSGQEDQVRAFDDLWSESQP